VVGFSFVTGDTASHATLWNGTSATDIGTLGGTSSAAYGINNAGQVVGESNLAGDTLIHATLWNGTSATDLGTLGGAHSSARAINSAGQVVGYSYINALNSDQHATLWNGTSVIDLNSLLDANAVSAGWVLRDATGINDSGWITGNAVNTVTGDEHAFLLTAVPEPESYAMMLVGLGIVGAVARRRRSVSA